MTGNEVVTRALSAMGRGTQYRLGRGGSNPEAKHPGDSCDCSGFIAWALGLKRKQASIGWVETSRICKDATGARKMFTEVKGPPQPGDLLVYPDRVTQLTLNGMPGRAKPRVRQGHVGIWTDGPGVIHCSSSNYRKTGDAIAITGPGVFWANDALIVRYNGIVAEMGLAGQAERKGYAARRMHSTQGRVPVVCASLLEMVQGADDRHGTQKRRGDLVFRGCRYLGAT